MSVTYTADVFCDYEGCGVWTHGSTSSAIPAKSTVRKVAKKSGWHTVGTNDYCPRCYPKVRAEMLGKIRGTPTPYPPKINAP